MSKVKKVQVVPVTSGNQSWQSLSADMDSPRSPDASSAELFNVNLLYYMNGDEFLSLLKQKTENNY